MIVYGSEAKFEIFQYLKHNLQNIRQFNLAYLNQQFDEHVQTLPEVEQAFPEALSPTIPLATHPVTSKLFPFTFVDWQLISKPLK